MAETTTPQPDILEAVTDSGRTITAAQPGDPEPYCFGRVLASPTIVAANDAGVYLVMDLLWSVGEIEKVEYLVSAGISEGLGIQLGLNQHFTGAPGQIVSSVMADAKGGTYDVLAGKAHSVLSWLPGYSLDIKAMIKGLKLLDPRNSPMTAIYSTNAALMLARIMTDCGYTMDWPSFATAANYCDELIGSPQAKRWEVGLQIRERHELAFWAHTFAQYCSCFMDIQGGMVSLVPDKPRAANHTVTKFVDGTVRLTKPGSKNVPSRVSVSYRTLEGPPDEFTEGAALAEDRTAETGVYTTAGINSVIQLPGIQTYTRALRKATEILGKAQFGDLLEFQSFDDGIERTIGDIGTITNAQFNLSAATMTLIKNKQIERGRWSRQYQLYSATSYSDATFIEGATNNTTLYNPYFPPPGPTPTAVEELYTNEAGITYSRFKITFNGYVWAYITGYKVTVNGNDVTVTDTLIDHTGSGVHTLYSGPLTSGITYTISTYIHSNVDAFSATPGIAIVVSAMGNNAQLDVGDVTNMHVYILDGDAKYATTSTKTGSPGVGITWDERFGATSPEAIWSDTITGGERWMGDEVVNTIFQTEIWDTGATYEGTFSYVDTNCVVLGGTKGNFVRLSAEVSPLSFSDNSGAAFNTTARFMICKIITTDSPASAGDGLHVKLPLPAILTLGAA